MKTLYNRDEAADRDSNKRNHNPPQEQDDEEAQLVSISLEASSENIRNTTKDSKADESAITIDDNEQRRAKERSTADTPSKKKKRMFIRALLQSLLFIDHTQIALVPPVRILS